MNLTNYPDAVADTAYVETLSLSFVHFVLICACREVLKMTNFGDVAAWSLRGMALYRLGEFEQAERYAFS